MTQTGYTNALVNATLGWLKGLANWVLKLFNLAGSSGGSPLLWLSQNWLKLLILLLIVGVAVDWLVWMIRWRPYWVWFRKKRIIVNDDKFLTDEDFADANFADEDDPLDQRYVVRSEMARRREPRRPPQRRETSAGRSRAHRSAAVPPRQTRPQERRVRPDDADDLFEVGNGREDYSDFFEDEVFNVSNLPETQENKRSRKRRK